MLHYFFVYEIKYPLVRKRFNVSIRLLIYQAVPHVYMVCVQAMCLYALCVGMSFLFPLDPLLCKPQSVARTTPHGP